LSKQKPKDMTGWQLQDSETQEVMGSVIITHREPKTENPEQALRDGWNDFNTLEETEDDHCDVDAFIEWFNESHVTQIDRLWLEDLSEIDG